MQKANFPYREIVFYKSIEFSTKNRISPEIKFSIEKWSVNREIVFYTSIEFSTQNRVFYTEIDFSIEK